MKEDKEKNYGSNKVEITTEDWIRLGLIYYLLILYGGVWVSPLFFKLPTLYPSHEVLASCNSCLSC